EEQVYYRTLTAEGEWAMAAAVALDDGQTTDSYAAVAGPDGDVFVWLGGSRREPGVRWLTIGETENVPLIDDEGEQPAVYVDTAGALHAAWLVRSNEPMGLSTIQYAFYADGQDVNAAQTVSVAELDLRSDSGFYGPWLAQEEDEIYVFWSESVVSGRGSGVIKTEFVMVPLDGVLEMPVKQTVDFINPRTTELPYEPFAAAYFPTTERVLWDEPPYPGSRLIDINVAAEAGEEIALAFRVPLQKERRETSQVAVLYMADGQPTSYQLLNDTFYNSLDPQITADGDGQLWLNWIERLDSDRFAVYVTTTHPAGREALNEVTADDVQRMSLDMLSGMLFNAVLTPFVFLIWMIVPVVLLLLTMFLWRNQDETINGRGQIALGLALLAYWVIKLFSLRAAVGYVPFSQWIPIIPMWLGVILQIVVPLVITYAAVRIAWQMSKRSDFQRVPSFMVVYALLDTLGTMIIYGEILYNAF
ncbi:MAG: hypothetical protein KDE51_20170, partial [Anaerolineales bacterium]|nr:hypothetical protein [Anaerolineales bacterium]